MKITLYVIGHLKEAYWKSACEEYIKRLKNYADIKVVEVDDIGYKEGAGLAIETQVKDKEGEKVLEKLKPSDYLCALDLNAKEYDSVEFASFLDKSFALGGSHLTMAIGGSLGFSEEVKKRANARISFGKLTFPHQLARVMALEQIYRAFRILNNEPYHK
jgi:23S rRNA (pseudouridine1915-N3)-methyltransferase